MKKEILEQLICETYKKLGTVKYTAVEVKKSIGFVKKTLLKYNIRVKSRGEVYRIFSEDQESEICQDYQKDGMNAKILAKKFQCSAPTILNIIKKYNIKRKSQSILQKKYSINELFFENPENWKEEQYYFWGWLLSDGYFNEKRGSITISLKIDDLQVLQLLKNIINYEGPLIFGKTNGFNNHICNTCNLTITNKCISEQIKSIQNLKNKTFNLEYPSFIKDHSHFLRGFWEGDGCISFSNGAKNSQIRITSTTSFLLSVKDILLKELNIKSCIIDNNKNNKNGVSVLCIGGNNNCIKFLNYIYKDKKYFLERKLNYTINFINEIEKNLKRRRLKTLNSLAELKRTLAI